MRPSLPHTGYRLFYAAALGLLGLLGLGAQAAPVLEQLASYKVPRSIEFRSELPRTETGKLQKRLLRDPYWVGLARRI